MNATERRFYFSGVIQHHFLEKSDTSFTFFESVVKYLWFLENPKRKEVTENERMQTTFFGARFCIRLGADAGLRTG